MTLIILCYGTAQIIPIGHETTVQAAAYDLTSPPYHPDDRYLDKQWALQQIPFQNTVDSTNIPVAILDTGIDRQHEDLIGKIISSINFTHETKNSDVLGHGTHIAGIITANTNNKIGIAGIAPNTLLLNVKVADDNGLVWPSTIAKGIIWATDNGAKIINISLTVPISSSILEGAVNYACNKGVIIIAAAGNDINSVSAFPACYPNVIAVAAICRDGYLWDNSNRGDVYAPGVEIYSALPGNNYGYLSGTSMAAACVSAIAAQLLTTTTNINNNKISNIEIISSLKNIFENPN